MPGLPELLPSIADVRGLRSRALFSWLARDGSIHPRTGQLPSFTRASVARAPDAHGRGYLAPHSAPRWEAVDLDGDGIRESAGLLLERGAIGNLITEPENFGAWTVDGTPVLNAGFSDPFGGVAAYNLGDDSAAAAESIRRSFTLGGDSAVAASLFLRQDGSAQLMECGLWDSTAVLWRHLVRVQWGGAAPSVPSLSTVLGSGQLFPVQRWATHNGGWWRIMFHAPGLIAANLNYFYLYPAGTTVANIASVFAFGAQVEGAYFPTSYQGTVLRSVDALTYPIAFAPQALTYYLRYVERGSRHESAEARLLDIGNSGPGTNSLLLGDIANNARVAYNNGGSVSSTLANTHAIGDLVELVGTLTDDGRVQVFRTVNGGALEVGALSSPAPGGMLTAWNSNTLSLQGVTGGARSAVCLLDAKVLPGVRTMQDCREVV